VMVDVTVGVVVKVTVELLSGEAPATAAPGVDEIATTSFCICVLPRAFATAAFTFGFPPGLVTKGVADGLAWVGPAVPGGLAVVVGMIALLLAGIPAGLPAAELAGGAFPAGAVTEVVGLPLIPPSVIGCQTLLSRICTFKLFGLPPPHEPPLIWVKALARRLLSVTVRDFATKRDPPDMSMMGDPAQAAHASQRIKDPSSITI